METIDLRKELKWLYAPSAKKVERVDEPLLNFIMIDEVIEPGLAPGTSPGFQLATSALFGAAYTLKFAFKKRPVDPIDYPVMALEGLWWVEDGHFDISKPDNWHYRLMIVQPAIVTPAAFAEAVAASERKKPNPSNAKLRLEGYQEGPCVQIMHVGPYATEPDTVAKLEAFAVASGWQMSGMHHEIYLGDPHRADQSKLKTILRHPGRFKDNLTLGPSPMRRGMAVKTVSPPFFVL